VPWTKFILLKTNGTELYLSEDRLNPNQHPTRAKSSMNHAVSVRICLRQHGSCGSYYHAFLTWSQNIMNHGTAAAERTLLRKCNAVLHLCIFFFPDFLFWKKRVMFTLVPCSSSTNELMPRWQMTCRLSPLPGNWVAGAICNLFFLLGTCTWLINWDRP
jgi:hypothetical protein